MEFDINDDPMTYEARPIFGYWTRRQSIVGACVIVSVAGVTGAAHVLGLPTDVAAAGSFVIGCVAGYFALSKRHGLYPEQWMPIMRAERDAPVERVWTPPRAHVEAPSQAREHSSRRERRRERKRRAAELETDGLLALYLAQEGLTDTGTEE